MDQLLYCKITNPAAGPRCQEQDARTAPSPSRMLSFVPLGSRMNPIGSDRAIERERDRRGAGGAGGGGRRPERSLRAVEGPRGRRPKLRTHPTEPNSEAKEQGRKCKE
eukprot:3878161-Prymnesium_polylepis.1